MTYENNYILSSNVSQKGGDIMDIIKVLFGILMFCLLILCLYVCIASCGCLDKTDLDPDTFLGGTFKKVHVKNWLPDKYNFVKLFR